MGPLHVEQPKRTTGIATAIVTGGASGIGRALGEEMARAGIRVVLADRHADLAETAAADIRAKGGAASAVALDVRDADRFAQLVRDTVAETGRLDFLFNNAGTAVLGEVRDYTLADWDDVIDVNLKGVTNGIHAAYPVMIEQGYGHIVNTGSMAGLLAMPLTGSYGASKHAVVGLTRALRIEAKQYGVKVSLVCPGAVRTPILDGGRYGRVTMDPQIVAQYLDRIKPITLDPAPFARRVLRGVRRNRAIIIEPRWWRILWYVDRLSPWLGAKLAGLSVGRLARA